MMDLRPMRMSLREGVKSKMTKRMAW